MIITSHRLLETGKTYNESDFNNAPFHYKDHYYDKYTFKVLKIATEDEYFRFLDDFYGSREPFASYEYHYEISLD